ncbi:helix-turn-helix transcriptional regulator [Citricoccus nitrophenolicus]|uniref:Helix-turn-helix transcriptional regulator n=1 Tax=Citricoccus nitrophenolicus TaxID=863575 RepID=A0ABV0IE39_9MICC
MHTATLPLPIGATDSTEDERVAVGKRLRFIRSNIHLIRNDQFHAPVGQQDIANALQIGRATVAHYERGSRNIPDWVIQDIAAMYGLDVDLFTPAARRGLAPRLVGVPA